MVGEDALEAAEGVFCAQAISNFSRKRRSETVSVNCTIRLWTLDIRSFCLCFDGWLSFPAGGWGILPG